MNDTQELLDGATAVAQAFHATGITAQEAADNLTTGLRPYFEYLERMYPDAFNVDGELRYDWMLIVYGGDSPWWQRLWVRARLLWPRVSRA